MTLAGLGAGLTLVALLVGGEISAVRSRVPIRTDRRWTWAVLVAVGATAVLVLPRLVELLT